MENSTAAQESSPLSSSSVSPPAFLNRIPSLDGLRAISILMVVIAHAIDPNGYPQLYAYCGHIGNYGVRIFFLISGFLITTLLLQEVQSNGSISLLNFYIRRSLRIFPAFYFYVGVVFLLAQGSYIRLLPGDMLHTLTFTMNYHEIRAWYLNHTWSLSVEEQFYLLWPAILTFAGPRNAIRFSLLAIAVVPLIRILMLFGFDASPTALGRQFQAVSDALATGCLLAGAYNRITLWPLYLHLQQSTFYILIPATFLALSGALYKASPPLYYILGQSVANLGAALLLDYAVRLPNSTSGRLLNFPALARIGTWSYSLYLWQQLFLDYEPNGLGIPFPWNVICTFATALLSFYAIEKQFFRLRHRFAS